MHTVYRSTTIQPTRLCDNSVAYTMNAGATPKFTASASESISSPIRDVALSTRATRPSSASRIAAAASSAIASVGRPSRANFTDVMPRQIASTVIALGSMRTALVFGCGLITAAALEASRPPVPAARVR